MSISSAFLQIPLQWNPAFQDKEVRHLPVELETFEPINIQNTNQKWRIRILANRSVDLFHQPEYKPTKEQSVNSMHAQSNHAMLLLAL